MKGRLAQVTNWPELARAAKYRTNELAKLCGVSTRELERFLPSKTGNSPRCWLNDLRQIDALSLLSGGKSVKETAIELGYTDPAHLSRDFKQFYGRPPNWAQRTTSPGGLA